MEGYKLLPHVRLPDIIYVHIVYYNCEKLTIKIGIKYMSRHRSI